MQKRTQQNCALPGGAKECAASAEVHNRVPSRKVPYQRSTQQDRAIPEGAQERAQRLKKCAGEEGRSVQQRTQQDCVLPKARK